MQNLRGELVGERRGDVVTIEYNVISLRY